MNRQQLLITKRRLRQLHGDNFISQTGDQKTNIIIDQLCKDLFLYKSKELIDDVKTIIYLAYENMLIDQNSDYDLWLKIAVLGLELKGYKF